MHRPRRLHAPEWFTADNSAVNVALVYPMQGPAGIFGPTCQACALLAAEEINKAGGALGRELRLLESARRRGSAAGRGCPFSRPAS